MRTQIHIWSDIGHTPITNRSGAYCDVLVQTTVECDEPHEARAIVDNLLQTVPHAHKGHYYMPHYWNQNKRSDWRTKKIGL
jgi:hypothetical protein